VAARLRARRDPDLPPVRLTAREAARQHEERAEHEQVSHEQEPRRPGKPEQRVVVEEPRLRENEREGRQRHGDPASREHDQRHQPDEVLRRKDLREREKAGDRSGEGNRQASTRVSRPRVQEPDRHNRHRFEHEGQDGNGVGQRPAQVAPGDARRLDDLGVVEPEPVCRQQHRGAEALDLKTALRL